MEAMRRTAMRKTAVGLAVLGVLAAAAPAQAGAGVKYKGKTSSGHPITFTLKGKRLVDMRSGISVSCISIQGGGMPLGGAETFSYDGSVPLSAKGVDFTFMKKPAFYYNEVTTKHTLSSKLNRRTGVISGKQRIQYSFLIPKYPIGTFSIYSCLGSGTFKAKPVKRG
jgi:hypothetical protein